jgi:hypothetical protein
MHGGCSRTVGLQGQNCRPDRYVSGCDMEAEIDKLTCSARKISVKGERRIMKPQTIIDEL